MSLDQETRINTVLYRIEKAQATWDDAMVAIEHKRWNMATNRLYYAVFHAASALLISKNIVANTHRGFLSQISLHLVKAEVITKEEGRLIRRLFELRHEDDYEDFIDTEEEEIKEITPQVRQLLDKFIRLNTLYQL